MIRPVSTVNGINLLDHEQLFPNRVKEGLPTVHPVSVFSCDTLMRMSIPYYHIDSFASELFAGNPAGVCFFPAFPGNDVMQKIAAENRHSETAFVVGRLC